MCVWLCTCVFVLAGVRDDPLGEQIDGIMHVLNIITMQNLDGILGGIQALMGLGNGTSIWDWTHTRARTHARALTVYTPSKYNCTLLGGG